jgi:hypothetical protein
VWHMSSPAVWCGRAIDVRCVFVVVVVVVIIVELDGHVWRNFVAWTLRGLVWTHTC